LEAQNPGSRVEGRGIEAFGRQLLQRIGASVELVAVGAGYLDRDEDMPARSCRATAW
jgi:hypothetical protein